MSAERVNLALLDAFRDAPLEDQKELARFLDFLERRHAQPGEPITHAYAELYGEVVFEDKSDQFTRKTGGDAP